MKWILACLLCWGGMCAEEPLFENGSLFSWYPYRANFGMERVYVRFPNEPAITQSNTNIHVYAYDHNVLYSLSAYHPPIRDLNARLLFDNILNEVCQFPCALMEHATYQTGCGNWVLDYVMHDTCRNLVVKSRTVVTPYNAYTLQTVFPTTYRESFDYFIDSFHVRCECEY